MGNETEPQSETSEQHTMTIAQANLRQAQQRSRGRKAFSVASSEDDGCAEAAEKPAGFSTTHQRSRSEPSLDRTRHLPESRQPALASERRDCPEPFNALSIIQCYRATNGLFAG